ncbi:MAG: hypothetical protein NT178_00105 [Proteobacteria bacterium]|nr:hypothetical protein [Pseudomonadota bacterium]
MKPPQARTGSKEVDLKREAGKEGSDVDVLIIGGVTFGETVNTFQEAQNIIGREINPTVYPVGEIRSKIAENKHFLKSVLNGPMIFLVGDKNDVIT